MHDEYRDLIIIAVVIFIIAATITVTIGLNMKGDRNQVKVIFPLHRQ